MAGGRRGLYALEQSRAVFPGKVNRSAQDHCAGSRLNLGKAQINTCRSNGRNIHTLISVFSIIRPNSAKCNPFLLRPLEDGEDARHSKFTWAVFESVGPMPDAIQDVWRRIFSEWFPTNEYEHADGPELEVYEDGGMSSPDYKCWVWIPVVKKSGK
jgi:hypothetical protein